VDATPQPAPDPERNGVSRFPDDTEKFFPSGAIFFFGALVVFYALLWLVIYGVMIARS
jgi:hypothetical protein